MLALLCCCEALHLAKADMLIQIWTDAMVPRLFTVTCSTYHVGQNPAEKPAILLRYWLFAGYSSCFAPRDQD